MTLVSLFSNQVFLPAFVFIGLEKDDCCGCCGHEDCGKRCAVGAPAPRVETVLWEAAGASPAHFLPFCSRQMFSSVLPAAIGVAGSGYCVIVAALGLAEGPLCLNSSGQWNYTFANTDGQ